MALHPNLKGALRITSAMASFTVNGATVKIVTPPINTGQTSRQSA